MNQEQWNDYLARSKSWAIRISHELLHSEAYRALKYAPTIKTLNWFYEKVRYAKHPRRRGKDRYELVNGGEMSFTYREARLRGLTQNQFSRALKELCHFGFIDVKKPGSGLTGDYTVFTLSDRWKNFGKPSFIAKEFPRSVYHGYRGRKRIQRIESSASQRPKLIVRKRT